MCSIIFRKALAASKQRPTTNQRQIYASHHLLEAKKKASIEASRMASQLA